MNYFLYARKSTDEDDRQMLSIESQLDELRELAKKEGIQIVREFVESMSAKAPGRPVFDKMVKEIERGHAEGVISWHPDRLARNAVDGGRIVHLLSTGYLKALKFPTFWFENTPQGKFMLNIAFGQSQYYVENLTENVWRGIRQKLRRGEYPSRAPVGYLNDTKAHTVIVDESKAPLVRRLFESYATDRYSASDLCGLAKEWGLTSLNGKEIRPNRMSTLLADPFYVGMFKYQGEIYDGAHPPIVPNSLFEQVQRIHKRRGGPEREKRSDGFPLLGLFVCGVCGGAITAERQKGHAYYRCTKKMGSPCDLKFIREEVFADELRSYTRSVSLSDEGAAVVNSIIDAWEKDERTASAEGLAREQARLADTEARLNRLLDIYLEGSLAREEYAARKEGLLRDKADAKEKIAHIQAKGAVWLEPARAFVNRANMAEKLSFSDDLAGIRDFLKIAGSNLRLEPPSEDGKRTARACPSGSEAEPPEGRESARRGVPHMRDPRADGTDPTAAAVPCRTSKPLSINGESNPARFAPPACGLARCEPPPASQAPSVRAEVRPLKFLGKAVPRVVVEFAEPWKSVARFGPRKEWSGRRGSNPRRSAWEADILPLNYSRIQ